MNQSMTFSEAARIPCSDRILSERPVMVDDALLYKERRMALSGEVETA